MSYKLVFLLISLHIFFPMFFCGNMINQNFYCYEVGQAIFENISKKNKSDESKHECNLNKYGKSINIVERNIIINIILYIMGFCYCSSYYQRAIKYN